MYFKTALFLSVVAISSLAFAANSCQPGTLILDRFKSEFNVKGITKAPSEVSIIERATHDNTEESLERTLMLVYAAIKSCSQDDSQGQGQPANPEEAQDFAQMGIRMIKDEYYRYALRHLTSNWVNMMWDWSQYILLGPLDVFINYAILKHLPVEEHEAFENKLRTPLVKMLRLKKNYMDNLWAGNSNGGFW